jgi:hypothetical protein
MESCVRSTYPRVKPNDHYQHPPSRLDVLAEVASEQPYLPIARRKPEPEPEAEHNNKTPLLLLAKAAAMVERPVSPPKLAEERMDRLRSCSISPSAGLQSFRLSSATSDWARRR